MFPLTFGPTQHISRCSLFLSSVRVILPPRHFSLPFFFSTSVPPHLFSPLISLGYWPCLSLLIQCSIGRSIERLSVKRGVEPPPNTPHLPLFNPPPTPTPTSPCLPRWLQTHILLGSWLSTSHTGEHLPPSPLRITFHLHSPRTWER